jgi:hypothetical protein
VETCKVRQGHGRSTVIHGDLNKEDAPSVALIPKRIPVSLTERSPSHLIQPRHPASWKEVRRQKEKGKG